MIFPVVLLLVALQDPKPRPAAPNLFAFPAAALEANRVVCGVDHVGNVCTAFSFGDGSIQGGAFWPKGTPDQYIFFSGLQVAALIPASAGFAWAGDTMGAYFFDTRGDQAAGTPRADVFNSLDSADAVNWPNAAVIRDATTFDTRLIGANAASQQDLWTRYWDGSPRSIGGRSHPMGLLVDQRLLAWNYPTGNEDIIYVVATLYNVTARTAGVYANATIPPELQSEIAAVGREFQDSAEEAFAVSIPDDGYAFDSMYVQLAMDHDIASFSDNYATAIVPFGLGVGYSGTFQAEVGWVLPPDPFGAPPFAAAPGLLGTAFLKAPAPFAIFTNVIGSAPFPDPVGVALLWRRMSGNMSPSDASCTGTNDPATIKARHYCFLVQTQRDSRYQMSVGPIRLDPGAATTIVLAYVFAPPLDTATAYVGGDLPPGVPFTGDSIALDPTRIRPIDRIAGWRAQSDLNGSGAIEASEVVAARRSLLHKTQVAQALVDAKFLLPAPPEPPPFFLIPGDNAVTIVWQPSATETAGDPYFPLASDPASALYDPNFRRNDVEGYRIYRGRHPAAMELVAQFDHAGTVFLDYLGAIQYPGRCAPELAILDDCPVPFPPPSAPDSAIVARRVLAQRIAQVPEGARFLTTNGALGTARADTFPTHLVETGVPYVYRDAGVLNSFRYYYAVTAFDFNSIRSGPITFESPRLVKPVTPRAGSGQETGGSVAAMRLVAGDGTTLDTGAPLPALDAATGIFAGPMPPTNGLGLSFSAFLPQVTGGGSLTVRIDSIAAGFARLDVHPDTGRSTRYYATATSGAGAPVTFVVPLTMRGTGFTPDATGSRRFAAVALDSAPAGRFGGDTTFALFADLTIAVPDVWRVASWGRAAVNQDPANSPLNGPRWWSGAANENTADPNGGLCAPALTFCGNTVKVPNIARTAGAIAGVTIFHPQSYGSIPNTPGRLIEGILATVVRAADFRVYWGAGGAVDSVVDVTHRVPVPFADRIGASWGLLTQASFAAVTASLTRDGNNTLLTWSDIFCAAPVPEYLEVAPGDTTKTDCGGPAQAPAPLQPVAELAPIAIRDSASSYDGTAQPAYTATGTGFIFYLNGHFFLMQMAALPAAGAVWNARFYSGNVTGSAAQADFAFVPATRPPAVPGLRAELAFTGTQLDRFVTTDSLLARVHTVPDPFYARSGYELAPDTLALKFVHLPARAIVRIYSLGGILVNVLFNDDLTGGGELTWDLRSRSGKRVASGVYFYHIETPDRRSRVGRFTVITGP